MPGTQEICLRAGFVVMHTSLCDIACGIHASYETLLFLGDCNTGGVRWPGKQAEVQTATELLVCST